ncbi:50S ribosomal protein P1 [Candidatus Woesearchaeota archaeon]|nr:50S ribosomal protein P1 [Candidatus Woesearchaeota archaeon]
MEYIYAAMLIHKAGGKIDEATIKKVMETAGAKPDDARVKALCASLEGINIDEAIQKASVAVAAPAAAAPAAAGAKEEKKEAKDDKKTEAEAAAGLGALFG